MNPYIRSAPRSTRVLTIAHRGARSLAPENTLPAFAIAARLGADLVEFDVRLTRDGKLAVFHDETLERKTDVREVFPGREPFRFSEFSSDEIRRLDSGSWFDRELSRPAAERVGYLADLSPEEEAGARLACVGLASERVRIPFLDEVLEWARTASVALNIELKPAPRRLEPLVRGTLERVVAAGLADRVLVSSFDHEAVRLAKRLLPGIAAAVLSANRLAGAVSYVTEIVGADAYHPGSAGDCDAIGLEDDPRTGAGLDRELFQSASEAGIGVNVWTVNDPLRMRLLAQAGATGIVTDHLPRLQRVLSG
ncbi:MAG: glycerophosphodiester phosphodiesterase [Planctomycetes bacterium]|nr:glycerophosphodiester phosphodiesterase [Planctomycetota bacterium]